MRKRASSILLTSILSIVLSGFAASAEAQTPIVGPLNSSVGGTIYIGRVVGDGRGWVVFSPNDGAACQFWLIGPGVLGFLQSNINVFGSKAGDVIVFPDQNGGPNTLCGLTFAAIETAGFAIEITANGGGDTIINTFVPNVFADGGVGNDYVLNYTSRNSQSGAYGWDGSDTFFSDPGDWLSGESGNDLFCVGGRAVYIDGGSGTDSMCGGTADTVKGIDRRNCLCGGV